MSKFNVLFRFMTFKRKLMAYSLLISMIPVLLLGMFSAFITAKSVQEEVNRNNQLILNQMMYQMNNFILGLNTSSILLSSSAAMEKSVEVGPSINYLNETFDMIETIRRQRSTSLIKYNVSVIYPKFDYVYSNLHQPTKYTESNFFPIFQTIQPKYSSSFIVSPDTYQNKDELLLFRPIPIQTNYSDGILVLHVNVSEIVKFLNQLNKGNYSKVFIVDEEGRIVASEDEGEIGTKLSSSTDLYQFWKNPEKSVGMYSLKGVKYKLFALKSSTNNWTYVTMTPMNQLTRKSDDIRQLTWGLIAAIALLWALISLVGSQRLYVPIERLRSKFELDPKGKGETSDGLQAIDLLMENMINSNTDLKNQLHEQLPQMKENFYHKLLLGEWSNSEINEHIRRMGIPLIGPWYYVLIAAFDQNADFVERYRSRDRALIHYALRKMIEEICENRLPCLTFTPQPGQVVVIFGMDQTNETTDETVVSLADEIRHFTKQYLKFTVSVSVTEARQDFSSMNQSYLEATTLLNCRLLMGHDITISAANIDSSIKESARSIIKWKKNILFNVIEGKLDEANTQLALMMEELPRYVRTSEMTFGLISYFIGELESLIQEMGCELSEIFEKNVYNQLYSFTTLRELQTWLTVDVFPTVKEYLEGQNETKKSKMILHVLAYVHENVETNISLQQLADLFRISPSHLSRVFKEETNTSFSEYLIAYRMDKAKEWLEHSDMSIKEISYRLCYSTVQNFSRVFRQMVGVPPGEYRKHAQNHDQNP
jgi:two-component system response regulator YesN